MNADLLCKYNLLTVNVSSYVIITIIYFSILCCSNDRNALYI